MTPKARAEGRGGGDGEGVGWQKKGNQENIKQLKRTDWEGMVHKWKRAQLSVNKALFIKLGGWPHLACGP